MMMMMILMLMMVMMMMLCKSRAQVKDLCVEINSFKLPVMQKTSIFTTFSARRKMAAEKRGQIKVFGRKFTLDHLPGFTGRTKSSNIWEPGMIPKFWSIQGEFWMGYPLVNIQIAIEHGHFFCEFSHETW